MADRPLIALEKRVAVLEAWKKSLGEWKPPDTGGDTTDPPTGNREVIGPQSGIAGNVSIINKHIKSSKPPSVDDALNCITLNSGHVPLLVIQNSILDAYNYGLWAGDVDEARIENNVFNCGPGGNGYCLRGSIRKIKSSGNTYNASHSFRVISNQGGYSRGDVFNVSRLMLGSGAADEYVNPNPFGGTATDPFIFEPLNGQGGKIRAVGGLNIYAKVQYVKFRNIDFTGTLHVAIQAAEGASELTFENCMKDGRAFDLARDTFQGASRLSVYAQRNIKVA